LLNDDPFFYGKIYSINNHYFLIRYNDQTGKLSWARYLHAFNPANLVNLRGAIIKLANTGNELLAMVSTNQGLMELNDLATDLNAGEDIQVYSFMREPSRQQPQVAKRPRVEFYDSEQDEEMPIRRRIRRQVEYDDEVDDEPVNLSSIITSIAAFIGLPRKVVIWAAIAFILTICIRRL
jgi:hypothetical protein